MRPDRSVRLLTENLVLRPTGPSDVGRALEIRSNEEVARNLAHATIPPDVRKMTDWFAAHAEEWQRGTDYRFTITLDDHLIGVCDIFEVSESEGEIGYWLDRAFWGRGYGLEAARRLVRFGLDELGLTSILAGCADDNVASAAILTRLGFARQADVRVFSSSRQEEITQRRFRLAA
jgi:[ribosomal protein S5]-alanine N-acetyltransferase